MAQVAALVDPGIIALLTGDLHQLASLMRLNFRLRRQLYGDAVLGGNLHLIQVRACRAHCKYVLFWVVMRHACGGRGCFMQASMPACAMRAAEMGGSCKPAHQHVGSLLIGTTAGPGALP